MDPDCERISWWQVEPAVLEREIKAMAAVAPTMQWCDDVPERGWEGEAPIWPFARPQPADLEAFLGDNRLHLRAAYFQAFPMVPPVFYPLEPVTDPSTWTFHDWHLNGDGSLCLLQTATAWTPTDTAADLVVKAASWFLEYELVIRELLPAMTECGLVNDDSLDYLFTVDRAPT